MSLKDQQRKFLTKEEDIVIIVEGEGEDETPPEE